MAKGKVGSLQGASVRPGRAATPLQRFPHAGAPRNAVTPVQDFDVVSHARSRNRTKRRDDGLARAHYIRCSHSL
jgi:hypothetical protein